MGRAFEFRKERKFKRWAKMAKVFTRIGKDIAIAVKSAGPNPESNSRLRILIQNAKDANMPKDNVERAIKRANSKDQEDYKEVVYEGYGPHGVAILVECTTDNPTRTVANVRSIFNRGGGSLGTSGSLDFIFDRKSVFKISASAIPNIEEFEFELIDYGVEEVFQEEDSILIYGNFTEFNNIQIFLEEKAIEVLSAEFERIPTTTKKLTAEQEEEINKMIEKFEEDDDVQHVFHNIG
jgi:YebC/PmpR family DNA-binding regulatory protein